MKRAVLIVLDSVGIGGARGRRRVRRRGRQHARPHRRGLRRRRGDREGRGGAAPRSQSRPARPRPSPLPPRPADRRLSGFGGDAGGRWGYGARARRARTRRRATGRSPACRCRWTGATFRETGPAFPPRSPSALIARGGAARHPRQRACVGDGGHRRVRRGTHPDRQADPLHLRRQRAADRRARDALRARAALRGLPRSRAGSCIRCMSAGSSRGPSSASNADDFVRTANRRDYAVPPPEPTLLDRLVAAGRQRRRHRQDRRHLRPPRHQRAGQGHGQRWRSSTRRSPSSMPPATATWSFANLVDFDMLLRPPPRRPRLCPRARGLRPPPAGAARRSCGPATSSSSPPTTATTRPGAAPTTPASRCRSSPSARESRRADRPPRLRRHGRDGRRPPRPRAGPARTEFSLSGAR